MKVLCVFGTRPEAIKLAPLIFGMKAARRRFHPVVCVTGQHREMLRQVLDTFDIETNHDLAVMTPNQTLAGMTARILEGTSEVIAREKPDVVMVQGDTTTAFSAGLSAFYHRVPLAHVEAGLRTGDLSNPFPEEMNRVLIDRFAEFCFAPTETNRRALLKEGVSPTRIFVTGNTGIDALLMVRDNLRSRDVERWAALWGSAREVIENDTSKIVLITAHRRESFGAHMKAMFTAIRNLARRHTDWQFIYPVHLNPNVREPALEILNDSVNIHLIEPLPYEPFVYIMDRAALILTDSGGIQEEAPSLGKRVVVMRETTERREALRAGTVVLGGNSRPRLEAVVGQMLRAPARRPRHRPNPYGDGRSASRILQILGKRL